MKQNSTEMSSPFVEYDCICMADSTLQITKSLYYWVDIAVLSMYNYYYYQNN